ncbi:hypothetical protein I5907_07495 [Panacibacter sp. DH6]|uniref:Uncharacterized protein n=1 Tax=Panacibacter microcysteis TaxID=2793269 RepID=A0A931E6P7_9BACT|nr:hypothetical protein [Panacibacter microcysteis]MBG9376073.1 hypothetical protein [Panacibacter microcysteis]
MMEQEARLRKKVMQSDSITAVRLFDGVAGRYGALQKQGATHSGAAANLAEYIPGLDSVKTTLSFLLQQGSLPELSVKNAGQLAGTMSVANELETNLDRACDIQSFVTAREAQLKAALSNTMFAKELQRLNKEVFYYRQRVMEYKAILNDRKKLEAKLLATVEQLPAFKQFMSRHGFLARLFPANADFGTAAGLVGLQTRTGLQTLIGQRLPATPANVISPAQYVQQQVQQTQADLALLKEKLKGYEYVSSDMTIPDFKPNEQHTKKLLQRVEYGINIQSERSRGPLPSTSDIAIHAGYKLNDRSSFGVGMSYKLGWGTGWNNIRFSHQGIGLRSYVDIKAKGSIWISAGYEYNYVSEFKELSDIKNIDVWERSGLIGITKKYAIGKKKEGKIQVLYDLLATKQIPQASPIKFRIGYNL